MPIHIKNNRDLGKFGEDLALKYLLKNGHEHVYSNFMIYGGEIDLITIKDNKLHFTEVKTVSREDIMDYNHECYFPEENIHRIKLQRMLRTALIFIDRYKLKNLEVQFDAATVRIFRGGKTSVEYFENVNL